jgi:hypothetical protein
MAKVGLQCAGKGVCLSVVLSNARTTNIGAVSTLDDAVAAFNPTVRISGKTIIRVRS